MQPAADALGGMLNRGDHLNPSVISFSGGDLKHGLGWVVLFCGLGTALLPFFGRGVDAATRRMVSQLALGAGSITLIYLIVSGVQYVAPGLVLAAVGYVLEITALVLPNPERGMRSPEDKMDGAERGMPEGRVGLGG
jgi:hypothetical protein